MGETDQSAVYAQKNAENQMNAAKAGVVTENPAQLPDEKDELIRNLNGRVEVLENQLIVLQKDREIESTEHQKKIDLLQEAVTKMEKQLQQFDSGEETEDVTPKKTATAAPAPPTNPKDITMMSSDEVEKQAKGDKNKKPVDKTDKTAKTEKSDKPAKKLNSYDAAQELFDNQEWKKAILSFQKYTDESPKGKNVADAKYKIGVCFQELGMKEEAMAFYEEVVANYQATEAGKKSKNRLAKLKK